MTPPHRPLLASRGALASITEVRRSAAGLLAALSRFTIKDAQPVAQIHEGPVAPDGTRKPHTRPAAANSGSSASAGDMIRHCEGTL
jgi:hypothetical protein